MDYLLRLLDAFLELFLEVLPFFALGVLLAGSFQATDDRLRLGSRLGSSLPAILLGATLGVVVPVCSCGVVPVAIGLLTGGVAAGPVFAFLAAAPMVNPASFVMTAGLLGYELALGRVAGALALAVGIGLLVRRFERRVLAIPRAIPVASCCGAGDGSGRRGSRVALALLHAGQTFVALLPYVLVGVLLGGLLEVLVRPEAVGDYFRGPASIPLAALASAPLYVCSCAEVPIALSLQNKGLEPAAILAFLLAGPGTSVFSLSMLWSVLRGWVVFAYAGAFLLGSVAVGFLWKGFIS